MPTLLIQVKAVNFTPTANLRTDWDDLLWAAITVGRPNRYYVFRHGLSSYYEAIFRASMIRMTLAESAGGVRFRQTQAFETLDPSEKGAINYFLGLTLCKLFAEKELNTPWLWHLDVFRSALNPQLATAGESRPDLVGQLPDCNWIAFESKGRNGTPDAATKQKAKEQAQRIVRVAGRPVTGHYAGISYFIETNRTLRFFVQDPEPIPENSPKALILEGDEVELFRTYYEPLVTIMLYHQSKFDRSSDGIVRVALEELDIKIGMSANLLELATNGRWSELRRLCQESQKSWIQDKLHSDGLWLRVGDSWRRRISRAETNEVIDE